MIRDFFEGYTCPKCSYRFTGDIHEPLRFTRIRRLKVFGRYAFICRCLECGHQFQKTYAKHGRGDE